MVLMPILGNTREMCYLCQIVWLIAWSTATSLSLFFRSFAAPNVDKENVLSLHQFQKYFLTQVKLTSNAFQLFIFHYKLSGTASFLKDWGQGCKINLLSVFSGRKFFFYSPLEFLKMHFPMC